MSGKRRPFCLSLNVLSKYISKRISLHLASSWNELRRGGGGGGGGGG